MISIANSYNYHTFWTGMLPFFQQTMMRSIKKTQKERNAFLLNFFNFYFAAQRKRFHQNPRMHSFYKNDINRFFVIAQPWRQRFKSAMWIFCDKRFIVNDERYITVSIRMSGMRISFCILWPTDYSKYAMIKHYRMRTPCEVDNILCLLPYRKEIFEMIR